MAAHMQLTTVVDPKAPNGVGIPDRVKPQRKSWWWGGWQALVCLVLYVAFALLEFGPFTALGSGRMTGPQTPDQVEEIWYLAWAQYALAHGLNPFFSHLQNYPVGINVLNGTSMMALGVLFSPITTLFGPIVTWNVLLRLAVIVSAFTMCLVLRRWTTWRPAAFLGGLLYGFSGFATSYGGGYLNYVFMPLPPLIFLLLHEILVRQRWRPMRTGLLLGAACGVQYLISSEILVTTLLMGAIGCVVYLIACRRELAAKWPYIRAAMVGGIVAGAVVLAYPVLYTLFGPQHINGVPDPPANLARGRGDLLGPILPGLNQWIDPGGFFKVTAFRLFVAGAFSSASMYLGLPLVVALVSIVVWLRRIRIVLLAGGLAAVAYVLSLGTPLYIDGHNTNIPLPFAVLSKLPYFDGLVASRISLFTALFGAGVLAVGFDQAYARLKSSHALGRLSPDGRVVGAAAICVAVAIVLALPLVPIRQATNATPVRPFFTSSSVSAIPSGGVVLVYPYPNPPLASFRVWRIPFAGSIDDALVDQAVSGMRFTLIGDYAWRPLARYGTDTPSPLEPASVEALFSTAFYGFSSPAQQALLAKRDLTADLRLFLQRYHVDAVVVVPLGADPESVVRHVTAAIGPPTRTGGVTAWLHVQGRLAALSHRSSETR